MLYAIDPGYTHSALVGIEPEEHFQVILHTYLENEEMCAYLKESADTSPLIIEMFEARGMPIGQDSIMTVWWSGRFFEAWDGTAYILPRRDIKIHVFGSTRGVNDAVVRRYLIDRYGPEEKVAVGSKKNPGPLYGMTPHERDALLVGIAWWELNIINQTKETP